MSLRPVSPMGSLWNSSSGNASTRDVRVDWSSVRDRIDLVEVATTLLGPAPGRRGERSARRLWWHCPFHEDRNPSFCIQPGRLCWRCWGCGSKGDAIELVRRLNPGWTFPEAVAYLTGQAVPSGPPARRPAAPVRVSMPTAVRLPDRTAMRPPDGPTGLDRQEAERLVADASERIWKPEGAAALAYLRGRCLTNSTIRAARLGWTPRAMLPTADGIRYWRATGIVIPWFDGDRLCLVKIRQPDGRKPRYAEAHRDRPRFFPGLEAIRPGVTLVMTEGELDALLLGQELAELAAVVTLGPASSIRPEPAILGMMLSAPVWYLATDADDAGESAASGWPPRARRVRPPAPAKDWTEAAQAGVNLRRWWTDLLGRIENPEAHTGDDLVERHGPGIATDGPPRSDRQAAGPAEESDHLERAAIMEFDGGLTREAADNAARLYT
jgi:hypothetical protein